MIAMVSSWVVIASVAVIYGLGWTLSGPMIFWGRWAFRGALLALLLGLTLPADVIAVVIEFLSRFIPNLGEISDEPGASFGMHFLLFLAVSTLLLSLRLDLALFPVLMGLIALAFLTEGLQALIPSRFADWVDVGTNSIGVALGLGARGLVAWARQKPA